MIVNDEHQKAGLGRELESTFWWAQRDRIKLPLLLIISDHQRLSAVSTELFRLKQEAMKPGEKDLIMALWLLNHSPEFLRVSSFPAQALFSVVKLSPFKASSHDIPNSCRAAPRLCAASRTAFFHFHPGTAHSSNPMRRPRHSHRTSDARTPP